jgi:ATP-dependent DNA helicase RecQ
VSLHAFTATATERVRDDIAAQLELRDPAVLVGDFDRPNLVYRDSPAARSAQTGAVRHRRVTRATAASSTASAAADVDELAAKLVSSRPQRACLSRGHDLRGADLRPGVLLARELRRHRRHGGLRDGDRPLERPLRRPRRLPKSIEHYQQETGRAGRDGLDAECVLFYSGADALLWKSIFQKGAEENEADPAVLAATNRHLDEMDRFARGAVCRHRALVEYFGQSLPVGSCNACDLCLGETELVPDSLVLAQKILSGVARTGQRFGAGYVVEVLRGSSNDRIVGNRHDALSVWGLMKDVPAPLLRDWTWQLMYPVLILNEASREVMRGEREVRLVQMSRPKTKAKSRRTPADEPIAAGADRALFDRLRDLRRTIASELGVPAYVVFGDRTLKELATRKPRTLDAMLGIHGIGEAKLEKFGRRFLAEIVDALT